VDISHVKVTGTLEIQCYTSDGILKIRDALQSGMDVAENEESEIDITLIGSPKYRIEVGSNSQRNAEAIIEKVAKNIISHISQNNGEAKFSKNV
jgi:translation initiation factor 2 subunit 1